MGDSRASRSSRSLIPRRILHSIAARDLADVVTLVPACAMARGRILVLVAGSSDAVEGETMKITKRWPRGRRDVSVERLPSYLLPPVLSEVVFDPTLQRAGELSRTI